MNCPHCSETKTQKRAKKTKLGYETFFVLGVDRILMSELALLLTRGDSELACGA